MITTVAYVVDQQWGTFLLSQATWIVYHPWRTAKSTNFIPKLYL